MGRDRAVSTVIDVTLALVFVSAAVMILAIHLDGDTQPEPELADRTAETLAGTTVTVEYSLAGSDAVAGEGYSDAELQRVVHGPAAGMLGDAAVTNVSFDGEPLTDVGPILEEAVDGAVLDALAGGSDHFHAVAVWRPHAESSIRGEASAGRSVPVDADVSAVTLRVPSGVGDVSEEAARAYVDLEAWDASETYEAGDRVHDGDAAYEALTDSTGVPVTDRSRWERLGPYDPATAGFEGASIVVAEAIVASYLPPDASNRSLEGAWVDRTLVVDRYERFGSIVGVDDFGDRLDRSSADAAAANALLIEELAPVIEADLEAAIGDDLAAIENQSDGAERYERIEATFDDSVSTGEVTIVVRTWTP